MPLPVFPTLTHVWVNIPEITVSILYATNAMPNIRLIVRIQYAIKPDVNEEAIIIAAFCKR